MPNRSLLLLVLSLGCAPSYECQDPLWTAGTCEAATVVSLPDRGNDHVAEDLDVDHEDSPPASGSHYGGWAKYGEYSGLVPERWVHNLEHGALVILHHPCASDALVEELRAFAKGQADDDGGDFRWILTPYPDLDSAFALVTWQWTFSSECFDGVEAQAFVAEHYRTAPEDVPADGAFSTGWIAE